jgi:putative ABC transport system permease protein
MYNDYFRFPELAFTVPLEVVLGATALTLGTAAAGAFHAVRRAVRVPPADAMRPETPTRYRRTAVEVPFIARRLGTAGRMVVRNIARHPFRAAASVLGIGLAVAILMVGLIFVEAMERLIATQFWVAERQDATVTFVEPRSAAATFALARVPGVVAVEAQRIVAARIRSAHRDRYLAITGVPQGARLRRIVDGEGRSMEVPPTGLVLSQVLADALAVRTGDQVQVETLEGARPVRPVEVMGLVDDVLGMFAYMDMAALHAMMREGSVTSGALLLVDPAMEDQVARQLKSLPAVTAAGFKRAALQSFRQTLAAHLNLTILVYVLFAAIIAFGVVYNAARVSLSERSSELASLRVLGFTRAEISLILLGELALLALAALPGGWLLGHALSSSIASSLQSEVYRFHLFMPPQAIGWASLATIAAALLSGLMVRSRLDRLDLVAVLKVGE